MADLAKLVVKLEAESSKLRTELEKSTRRLDYFGRNAQKNSLLAQKAINNISSTASFAFKSIAAAVGGVSLVALTKNVIDSGDKIQKLSIRLGASTEALSQFRHVAELSGVSFETMTMGLQRMTRRLSEAVKGSGEAVGALNELGLSAVKLQQLRPEDQFAVLAEKISQIENPAVRVRIAMKLFDSEGVALLQTMENGAAGINQMRMEADRLGLTLSKDSVDAMARANDGLARLTGRLRGMVLTIIDKAIPSLEKMVDQLNSAFSVDTQSRIREITFEIIKLQKQLREDTSGGLTSFFNDLTGFDPSKAQQKIENLKVEQQKLTDSLKPSVSGTDTSAFEGRTLSASELKKGAGVTSARRNGRTTRRNQKNNVASRSTVDSFGESTGISLNELQEFSRQVGFDGVPESLRRPLTTGPASIIERNGNDFSDHPIVSSHALDQLNEGIDDLRANGVEFAQDQIDKLREPFIEKAVDVTEKITSGKGGGTLSFFSMEEVFKNMGLLEEDVKRVGQLAGDINMPFPDKAAESLNRVDSLVSGVDRVVQKIGIEFDKNAAIAEFDKFHAELTERYRRNPIFFPVAPINTSISQAALASGSR